MFDQGLIVQIYFGLASTVVGMSVKCHNHLFSVRSLVSMYRSLVTPVIGLLLQSQLYS